MDVELKNRDELNELTHDLYFWEAVYVLENKEKGFVEICEARSKLDRSYQEYVVGKRTVEDGLGFNQKLINQFEKEISILSNKDKFLKASFNYIDEVDIKDDYVFYFVYYDMPLSYFFIYEGDYYYSHNWDNNPLGATETAIFKIGSREDALELSEKLEHNLDRFEDIMNHVIEKDYEVFLKGDYSEMSYLIKGDLAKYHLNGVIRKYNNKGYII